MLYFFSMFRNQCPIAYDRIPDFIRIFISNLPHHCFHSGGFSNTGHSAIQMYLFFPTARTSDILCPLPEAHCLSTNFICFKFQMLFTGRLLCSMDSLTSPLSLLYLLNYLNNILSVLVDYTVLVTIIL